MSDRAYPPLQRILRSPWFSLSPALVVWALTCVAVVFIYHHQQQQHRLHERSDVANRLATYRAQLEGMIHRNIMAVQGLVAAIGLEPQLTQDRFERLSAPLFRQGLELRNVGAAPDMVVAFVYPLAGNEGALGLNFLTHPGQTIQARKARDERRMVLAGPLPLVQGGIGLVGRVPIFTGPDEEIFWGLLSAVIDIDAVYQGAGLTAEDFPLRLSIRGVDGLGASGAVFYGDGQLFAQDSVLMDLSLPGGMWRLAAEPLGGWTQPPTVTWEMLSVSSIGALLALMMGWSAWWYHRQRRDGERFALLAEYGRTMTWEVNKEGLITYLSPTFATLTGFSVRDFVGKVFIWDLHPPAGREDFRREVLGIMERGGTVHGLENPLQTCDGSVVWVNSHSVPNFDHRGRLRGYRGSDTDISERKQAENQREVEINERRILLDHIQTQVWYLTDACTYGAVNRAHAQFMGREASTLAFQNIFDLMPPEVAQECERSNQMVFSSKQPQYVREWAPNAAGEMRLLAIAKIPRLNDDGSVQYAVCSAEDITDMHQAMAAVKQSAAMQRLLTEIALQYIQLPVEQLEQHINGSLGKMAEFFAVDRAYVLIYDDERGTYTNTHEWCAPEISAELPNLQDQPLDILGSILSAHRSGEAYRLDRVDEIEAGAMRDSLVAQSIQSLIAVPMMQEGRCIGCVGFDAVRQERHFSDEEQGLLNVFAHMLTSVLARRENEDRLRQATAKAEAAAEAKTQFLANMSHEIRTPMNGIMGMTELLLETPLDPQQKDWARTVYASSEHLLRILNDILDFSRMEAGHLVVETLRFDLPSLLHQVIDPFRATVRGGMVALHIDLAPQFPQWWRGDPSRLRQILLNLVGNAVKFTSEGTIVVSAQFKASPHLEQGEEANDPALIVTVKDSGIGIPASRLSSLFKPFEQVDNSTSRVYGGTGLGLAICARLAAAMGGHINVESCPGQGSTFAVALAMLPDGDQGLHAETAQRSLAGRRVLIVAPPGNHRDYVYQQLDRVGAHVSMTMAATELEEGNPYHRDGAEGIFADASLGEAQLQALIACATKGPESPIPVVAFSALGQPGEGATMAALGCRGYVVTPCAAEVLGQIMAAAIAGDQPSLITRHTLRERSGETGAISARPLAKLNILLVEDNTINQRMATHLLERMGASVSVASDGREAVAQAAATPFSVVLMDVHMPGMDGFAATAQIRQNEALQQRHTPIIALTANAMEGDRDRCLAAGMDDYLSKPLRRKELLAVIQRMVDTDR